MPLVIPQAVRAAIYAHARSAFPAECCGYLVGPRDGAAVTRAVPCRNAQPDGVHPTAPDRGADAGFVIAGAELFAFARTLDTAEPARVVYHSHPAGGAYFSAVDREVAISPLAPRGPAYPVEHLVIGVTAAGVHEAAQFAWAAAAGDFVEVARWSVS